MSFPYSASVYYQRVFMENFLKASGTEPLEEVLQTAIDNQIEDIVRTAGKEAGLKLRSRWLRLKQ